MQEEPQTQHNCEKGSGSPTGAPEQRLPIGGAQVGQGWLRLLVFRPADPGISHHILQKAKWHRFTQRTGYEPGYRAPLKSIHFNYLLDGCLTHWAVSSTRAGINLCIEQGWRVVDAQLISVD